MHTVRLTRFSGQPVPVSKTLVVMAYVSDERRNSRGSVHKNVESLNAKLLVRKWFTKLELIARLAATSHFHAVFKLL